MINNKDSKPKIVLLLGYPRSGSTVFGELINQLDSFIHVGEMERLWYPRKNKAAFYPQKECSCGKQLYECDFWLPYFDKVAEKIQYLDKEEKNGLNSKILCGYKEDFIQKGKIHSKEANIYTQVLAELYNELYQGEQKIILDSSKELWYAKYLESTGLFDLSYIHLVRDVKGNVYSRQKKLKKLDEKTGKVSLDYKYLIYDTLRWNLTNSNIKKFLRNKNHLEVSYEDLIINPKDVLTKLGEMCNENVNAEKAINNSNEFVITENHLVHGNRFRFERGTIKLTKDTRWLEEMKSRDINLINALSWFKLTKN